MLRQNFLGLSIYTVGAILRGESPWGFIYTTTGKLPLELCGAVMLGVFPSSTTKREQGWRHQSWGNETTVIILWSIWNTNKLPVWYLGLCNTNQEHKQLKLQKCNEQRKDRLSSLITQGTSSPHSSPGVFVGRINKQWCSNMLCTVIWLSSIHHIPYAHTALSWADISSCPLPGYRHHLQQCPPLLWFNS